VRETRLCISFNTRGSWRAKRERTTRRNRTLKGRGLYYSARNFIASFDHESKRKKILNGGERKKAKEVRRKAPERFEWVVGFLTGSSSGDPPYISVGVETPTGGMESRKMETGGEEIAVNRTDNVHHY